MGLDNIRKAAATATRAGSGNSEQISFPFEVKSYDLEHGVIKGVRLDTGDDVSVRMREDAFSSGREYKRPEVKDFASDPRKSKVATDVGGTLRADRCYQEPDGTWNAGWIAVMSHTKDEARILVGVASLENPAPFVRGGEDAIRARIMVSDSALLAEDRSSMSGAIAEILGEDTPYNAAALRIVDQDGDADAIEVRAHWEKQEGAPSIKDGDKAAANFLATAVGAAIADVVENGASVEVIPMLVLTAGKSTFANMKKGIESGRSHNEAYKMGDGIGWQDSVIAIRSYESSGSLYFTEVAPVGRKHLAKDFRDAVLSLNTPHSQPLNVSKHESGPADDLPDGGQFEVAEPTAPAAEEKAPEKEKPDFPVVDESKAKAAIDGRKNGTRTPWAARRPGA